MARQPVDKDFFEQAKGFVASFNQVIEEGFFESIYVDIKGLENFGTTNITIRAEGLLPDHDKDWAHGVTPFIDPADIIDAVREQLLNSKFSLEHRTCEVKTVDWVKYGTRKGEEVVTGKKGLKLSFTLSVYLKPKFWK